MIWVLGAILRSTLFGQQNNHAGARDQLVPRDVRKNDLGAGTGTAQIAVTHNPEHKRL